jgi:hypothetical protein
VDAGADIEIVLFSNVSDDTQIQSANCERDTYPSQLPRPKSRRDLQVSLL